MLPGPQQLFSLIPLCVTVCVRVSVCLFVCPSGVQSQEELLLPLRHRVGSAEQPHPPAEEDVAGHRQVGTPARAFFHLKTDKFHPRAWRWDSPRRRECSAALSLTPGGERGIAAQV